MLVDWSVSDFIISECLKIIGNGCLVKIFYIAINRHELCFIFCTNCAGNFAPTHTEILLFQGELLTPAHF